MILNNYKRLGDYIREVNVRNRDLAVTRLMGININKHFMPSVANTIGTDMSTYKIVEQSQFACNLMHVGRDEKIPIAIQTENDKIIVSPAYFVFEVIDKTQLLPEYLMMWFSRAEFDRNAWFYTDADVRGGMNNKDLLTMTLPIPDIAEQQRIVSEYKALSRRIAINEQICTKLEETAQALYRKMFVDDIDKENLPEGWRMGTIGELGKVVGGSTPSTTIQAYWTNNGVAWISPADLSKNNTLFIKKGSKDITVDGYNSTSTNLLPKGSVLFSSRAPIGLIAIADNELCTNQGFKSIIPNDNIGTAYIYYFLNSMKEQIANENSGSTFDEVSGETLKNYGAIIPSPNRLDEFRKKIEPIFGIIRIIEKEINISIQLQSLLLAKMGRKEN